MPILSRQALQESLSYEPFDICEADVELAILGEVDRAFSCQP